MHSYFNISGDKVAEVINKMVTQTIFVNSSMPNTNETKKNFSQALKQVYYFTQISTNPRMWVINSGVYYVITPKACKFIALLLQFLCRLENLIHVVYYMGYSEPLEHLVGRFKLNIIYL